MIRPENQRVWSKSLECLGRVIDSRKLPGEERTYRFATLPAPGLTPIIHRVPRSDLRTADKLCDGCNRWLPNSSFYGGGQYHNPIDGVIEVEFCFLCVRSDRQGDVAGWVAN